MLSISWSRPSSRWTVALILCSCFLVTAGTAATGSSRAWWSTGQSAAADSGATTLVISEPVAGADIRAFENYLSSLLATYRERGLRVVQLRNGELDDPPPGLSSLDPSVAPSNLGFPVAQMWRGEQTLLFDGSGRPIGLDTLHQLVRKHLGDGAPSEEGSPASGGQDWFLGHWRELDYWYAADGRRLDIASAGTGDAALLVIPGGCSKCVLSKYENDISDLAGRLLRGGRELIILLRNSGDADVVAQAGSWGTVAYFAGVGDSDEALRTRYDSSARPFVCEFAPETGELQIVHADDLARTGQ